MYRVATLQPILIFPKGPVMKNALKKTIVLAALACIASSPALSSAASKKIYLVEPMTCKGKRTSERGYDNIELTFTSFKSTRRDGSKANSLEVSTSYSSNLYTGPLYLADGRFIKKELGAYDEHMDLKVVRSSDITDKGRKDILRGTLTAKGTVVGDTSYDLVCVAQVVNKVSRVDDFTARD
jgi:hypothetical protein